MRGLIRGLLVPIVLLPIAFAARPHVVLAAHAAKLHGAAAKIDAFLTTLTKKGQFQGTILVTLANKTVLKRGYGWADVSSGRKNAAGTQFSIASITKQFTATAILQLQEHGKLSVDDPICRYVPACPTAWQPITLTMLLTHTSGIPDFPDRGTDLTKPVTADAIVTRLEAEPLDFTPGSRWSYSNAGYDLLGYVIQQVSGESWAAYVQQYILAPVRMTHTGVEGISPSLAHATGYGTIFGSTPVPTESIDSSFFFSSGSLFSTVGDLQLWDRALASGKVISPQSLTEMFKPRVPIAPGSPVSYGYGWLLTTFAGHTVEFHDGSLPGFQSVNIIDPGDKLTVVVLANDGTADATDIGFAIGAFALKLNLGIQPTHRVQG